MGGGSWGKSVDNHAGQLIVVIALRNKIEIVANLLPRDPYLSVMQRSPGRIGARDYGPLAAGSLCSYRWHARCRYAGTVLCAGSTASGSSYGFALRIRHPV